MFNCEIDKLLKRLPKKKDLPGGPRVMVVGNFINEDKLWEILSELDCHMVYDDVCTLSRYFNHEVTNYRQNPVHALATSYLQKPSCMRMADLGLKLENLKKAIEDYRIQALIFVSLKFCDNTLYFYPLARQNLGLPVLNLELEYNNFSEGQIKTRLEAFLEML
ncbi:MAG: 2-hydroxyacyl-CoA dehydratase family protein [Actinomycetota bacterium]|nr:2-hydroxyacyl-CoA dehydratase family protein [Actinomycetota bacterium]